MPKVAVRGHRDVNQRGRMLEPEAARAGGFEQVLIGVEGEMGEPPRRGCVAESRFRGSDDRVRYRARGCRGPRLLPC